MIDIRSGALLAALLATAAASAAEVTPAAEPATALQAVRVVRDKDTGKLRAPSQDELAALLEAERSARAARGEREPTGPGAPLVLRRHANGMVSAVLGADYLVTVQARRDATGKLVTSHDHAAHEHPVPPQQQRPTE